jgi:hypothetical protein
MVGRGDTVCTKPIACMQLTCRWVPV